MIALMVRGWWCRTNNTIEAQTVGHDAKKMKKRARLLRIACRGRVGWVALTTKHVVGVQWEAGAVAWLCVLVGVLAHTSQFNADGRKWITVEVLQGAHQYTQEQRDVVTA